MSASHFFTWLTSEPEGRSKPSRDSKYYIIQSLIYFLYFFYPIQIPQEKCSLHVGRLFGKGHLELDGHIPRGIHFPTKATPRGAASEQP